MAEDAEIRRENFKRFCDAQKPRLTPALLSDKLGSRTSYWNDLLTGKKSFGEKIARRIEGAFGMPRGALDEADADLDTVSPPPWPFERLPPELWAQLTERQRGVIEDAAVRALLTLTAERPPPLAALSGMTQPAGLLQLPRAAGKQVQRKGGTTVERRRGDDRRQPKSTDEGVS